MKIFPIIALLAGPAALVFSPLNLDLAISLVFVAGLAAIMIADYSRRPQLQAGSLAPLRGISSPACPERLRLAA